MAPKRLIEFLGILLVALLLGVGSAVWVLDSFTRTKIIRDRAWTSSPLVGSVHADMYLRAFVARTALFALSKTEALYYNAFTDEDGEPLRAECDYIVEGSDVPARWWSITAYDENHFLVPNRLNRYSYHMRNLRRDEKGHYRIHLSQTPKDHNWLPSPRQGNLSLTLRAYNPAPALAENIGAAELPTIMKAGCK